MKAVTLTLRAPYSGAVQVLDRKMKGQHFNFNVHTTLASRGVSKATTATTTAATER